MDSLMGMILLFIVVSAVAGVIKTIHDARLLKENPDGWRAMKQVEMEEKERKQRATKAGVDIGLGVFQTLFKK